MTLTEERNNELNRSVSVSEVSGGYKATVRLSSDDGEEKTTGAGTAMAPTAALAIQRADELAAVAFGPIPGFAIKDAG